MRRSRLFSAALLALAACDGRPPPDLATARALLAPRHGAVEILGMERLHGGHWRLSFRSKAGEGRAALRHADGVWRLDDPTSVRERLRFL